MTNDPNHEKPKPLHVINSANCTNASIWKNADNNGEVCYRVIAPS
jgi:hypothetical protein